MGCPDQCNCVKCCEQRTAISKSGSLDADDGDDGDDDTRERAAGGRLVKAPDPRKKDPADAEPLPTGGLSDRQVAELRDVFDRAADASAPDGDELNRIDREMQRRRGRSKVDLTERDIEEARMSTREQLLEALEGLGSTADAGPTLRKQDGDDGDDTGEHGLREQDLAEAVADLLDVSVSDVMEGFDRLRDGDGDGDGDGDAGLAEDELAEAVADMLGVPVGDVLDVFEELETPDADGSGDGGDGDADTGPTGRSKATVRKSVGGTRLGSDADGRAALVTDAGDTVPLDALAGTGR